MRANLIGRLRGAVSWRAALSLMVASAALWAAPAMAVARAPALAPSDATLKTFDACVRSLRSTPYMRSRDDIDWRALEREWRPRADAAAPGLELREVLNAMVAEVGASHAAVLSEPIYRTMMNELSGKPSPTFGVLLEEMVEGRLFVRALFERGPAEQAGLRIGDEIVAVAGDVPFDSEWVVDAGYDPGEEKSRLFTLATDEAGEGIDLRVRSQARGPERGLQLTSESTSGLEAGRRSIRIVSHGGHRIGVIHLWMVARGSAQMLADALRGPLARCDALIVDLRGRGGYADEIPGLLAPFRAGRKGSTVRSVAPWRRPVAFLIDDRTRSAKEILAWNVRAEGLGALIGERTEGAVLGAGFFPLPGGHFLEAPLMEVPVGDGSSLEGVGVAPTEAVERAGPYAQGVDPLLRRALSRLAAALHGTPARRGPY